MKSCPLSDLIKTPEPPPLFQGFLPDDALIMVSGEPYTAKTMLLMEMAICLDHNLPLFGQFSPVSSRSVLMIGQDAPTFDYARQARKLLAGRSIALFEQDLSDVTCIINQSFDLTNSKHLNDLAAVSDSVGADILMIDTLLSVLPGVDENSNSQMSDVMAILKSIRERANCCVIFTHHTAKPSAAARSPNYAARGAVAIVASVDYHLQLHRRSDYIKMLVPKGRGDDAPPIEGFRINRLDNGLRLDPVRDYAAWILEQLPTSRTALLARFSESFPLISASQVEQLIDNGLRSLRSRRLITSPERGTYAKRHDK